MTVPEITIDEFAVLHAQGVRVFDVREPDEYTEAHVPGAVLIPLATVPDEVDRFPTDGPVYVICAAGGRSRKASEFLRANGVDAINIAGGTRGWLAADMPVAVGNDPG
jgi:rhodanese-related sulfurtransferase